ncbi:MAG: type II restriction endonuclease [Candidatus Caldatribacteriota bacterium]|nr:type II restriction endonuclease [Candidatus Caldatribacteriota bacterium]
MKFLDFYKNKMNCNTTDEVFNSLISNLKPSNRLWSYFVNWEKVFSNTKKIEVSLNILNYLIGKDNFEEEFKYLVREHPEIIEVIPALVVRNGKKEKELVVLVDFKNKKMVYENYNFNKKNPSDEDIKKYLVFIEKTGLKELLVSKKIKNLVDYMIGIEAGLDSNGRKNRGGKSMEKIVEVFLEDYCKKSNCRYLKEANAQSIREEFGFSVPVDKSSRRYDFVIDNKIKPIIIETNFYGGGGSKLKSTTGEYQHLNDILKNDAIFIWITDGFGWISTKRPLREAFENNDYIFNLYMLENGVLNYVI